MITDQSSELCIIDRVIQKHNGEHVMSALPKTSEMSVLEVKDNTFTFPLIATVSFEVFLIRVYYLNDRWRVSTGKKLDAFDSFWGTNESFGSQFEHAVEQINGVSEMGLDLFFQSLDQNNKYFFLVPLKGEQRIDSVREDNEYKVWLAAVEDNQGVIQMNVTIDMYGKNVWDYLPRIKFETREELKEYIVNNYKTSVTGVMIHNPEKNVFVKIVHPEYLYKHRLRGNKPNIRERYIDLLKNNSSDESVLRSQHDVLEQLNNRLKEKINLLHKQYCQRYIHKDYQLLPRYDHITLKECHAFYIENRKPITAANVREILLQRFSSKFILKLLDEKDH